MKTLKVVGIIVFFATIGTTAYWGWARYTHSPQKNSIPVALADSNIAYYHCGMHPWVISKNPGKCPICGMDLTPVYKNTAKNSEGIVTINPAMVQDIGVQTEKVIRRKLTHTIRTSGIVGYDEKNQTVFTTKFPGWIEKLYVDYTGAQVQKGQPVFDIYSPELVAAQQEYLQAIKYRNTVEGANDTSVGAGANNLLQSAKRKLMYWDISEGQIRELARTGNVKKTLTLYSPFSGIVIEKNVYEGMQVQAGMNLLKIADMSEMWVYADIYESDLAWIKKGENAIVNVPSMPGQALRGTVAYIYPFLQDQTRTAKVRIDLPNVGQFLKKDMYVTVNIVPAVSIDAIAVPEQSVIHSGRRNIVVLSLGNGRFKPVDVTLGVLADGYYQVISGVSEGDIIVTSSQFLIDSESNLKATGASMQGMDMSKQNLTK